MNMDFTPRNLLVMCSLSGLLLGCATSAQAQTEPAAAPPPAATTAPTATPGEDQPAAVEAPATAAEPVEAAADPAETLAGEDGIVIEYIEADLQSVLRSLASRAGVNLIMGDEVIGKVTVHLENIAYEEAMKLVAESKGYAFVREKNIVKVKSKESLDAEPVELRVVTLNYAKAETVRTTIQTVLTPRGTVQVDVRSNTLIISDTPSNLTKLMPLVESLDSATPQVLIEAKFIETSRNPKKDLGVNWAGTLLNHQVTAGGSAISDQPGDPPTIIVDDVNKPLSGFQWVKQAGGSAFTPWQPGAALLDIGTASAVFSFLLQDSESELLANPRVVATDNQRARLSIATQYPIPNFSFSEQTASLQISGFEYKDIGIILDVLPRVNKNEFVTLEVTPEASSSSETTTLQSGGGSAVLIPIINTRTATTTVLIKSGHTLAIGGLMRQDSSDSYTKVPVLGDLPGVGSLFRSKSLSKTKRDLLIFLTPTVIPGEGQTGYEKYVDGFPKEEIYTNDKWQPTDNAKPRAAKPQRYFRPVAKDPMPNEPAVAAAPVPDVVEAPLTTPALELESPAPHTP